MATSIKLTSAQISDLKAIRAQCEARGEVTGAWAPFYDYLAKAIRNTWYNAGNLPVTDGQILSMRIAGGISKDNLDSLIWLMGGSAVNSDTGVFNSFIRLYNAHQGEMRIGVEFGNDLMQEASNEVARRMADQILGELGDPSKPGNGGVVPTVQEIGEVDLDGVRDVLWGRKVEGEPMFLNQAWPGIVILGAQGRDFLGRLLQPNALRAPTDLDTLGDIQNLLCAWESFKYAFDATCALSFNETKEFAIAVGLANVDLLMASISGLAQDEWAEHIFDVLIEHQNPEARNALKKIHDISSVKFLDMLRRTWAGESEQANDVASDAYTFFNQFSAADLNSIKVEILDTSNAGALVTAAESDISVRNALKYLSVVAIELPSYDGRQLELYSESTDQGDLSKQWLKDRAAMLTWTVKQYTEDGAALRVDGPYNYDFKSLKFNADDSDLVLNVTSKTNYNHPQRIQIVFGSDEDDTITGMDVFSGDHLYGGDGKDTINGVGGNDWIEGNAGDDDLRGDKGKDTLFGGTGADTLKGGKDGDTLKGGKGQDTYVFASGDGWDWIDDSDGQGLITYDGATLTGGERRSPNIWKSADEKFTYSLYDHTENGQTYKVLSVSGPNGGMWIKDWQEGELGINLGVEISPVVPTNDRTISGGYNQGRDDLGNPYYGDYNPNRNNTLYDSVGNDLIKPGAGDDTIYAERGGDDRIESGGGIDFVTAGDGKDWLIGGAGRDNLFGMEGDDRLFGTDEADVNTAIANGKQGESSNEHGDWMSGWGGSDTLVGGEIRDLLAGGNGDDLLVAGASTDFIEGDGSFGGLFSGNGLLTYRSEVRDDGTLAFTTSITGTFIRLEEDAPGADTIYAGAGDDWAKAGGGNDLVMGEGGDDLVAGEAGNDTLLGGVGDDTMNGDNALSELSADQHGDDFLDGGDGNDSLYGNSGSDTLYGGSGNDQLVGDSGKNGTAANLNGDDYLDGEDGNDKLFGGGGADTLYGGAGDDEMDGDGTGFASEIQLGDYLDGEEGNDLLIGGGGQDTLYGGTGDDTLAGEAANTPEAAHDNDYLDGGEGHDILLGGGKSDALYGGKGNDQLFGDANDTPDDALGDDYLDGGDGNDYLFGNGGKDTLLGGKGNDQLVGDDSDTPEAKQGEDYLDGGDGNDILIGGGGKDVLLGGSGNDQIDGDGAGFPLTSMADDYLDGGSGDDTLIGNGGADTLLGGLGNDILAGDVTDISAEYDGADYLDGGSGNDQLLGGGRNDTLLGGAGDDVLDGDASGLESWRQGSDYLDGGAGNDYLIGRLGADTLIGGEGDDTLWGDSIEDEFSGFGGADVIDGGTGNDYLFGGNGNDILDGGDGDVPPELSSI